MPFVAVNDINLHYIDSGPAAAPLVFLHGWGTSGRVWDQQAAHFAPRHRVIQLDWRGCGRSDAQAHGNSIAQIASDVSEVLDQLDLEQVTLIGTSMGASFAIEAARHHPERLRSVVSVDGPFHLGTLTDGADYRLLAEALSGTRVPTLMSMVSAWYSGEDAVAYEAWARSQVLESSPHIAALFLDHLAYDPRAYLRDIGVPIALIHGADDPNVPVAIASDIAALLEGAPLHVIEGAGHFPHHTSAPEFNAVLESVLYAQETGR